MQRAFQRANRRRNRRVHIRQGSRHHPRRKREIGSLERRTNVPVAQRERAEENRAYVRRLLWEREPEFAAALAAVERSFSCPPCPGERDQDDDRASHLRIGVAPTAG